MSQSAGVDLRRGKLIAFSSSRTTDGLWVANGTFEILDALAGDRELGESVLRMLATSESGVPAPDLRSASPFAPVLAAVGVRSYAGYARGTTHVDVESGNGPMTVTASRNGGSREGFVGLPDPYIAHDADPEALGRAVRAALARCT